MTTEQKKEAIKEFVIEMLEDSQRAMTLNIDKVLNSGAIDIDDYNEGFQMAIPKAIVIALLLDMAGQYEPPFVSMRKIVIKEVKNILHFL